MDAANASAQTLIPSARRFAGDYLEFSGLWLELPVVVIAFADNVAAHRAEAETLFGDRVIVREARYTLRDLQAFVDTIEADRDWFSSIGATIIDVGLDEMANAVNLQYRAPSQATESLVRERFGEPDWLRLDWAGPPRWTGPYGDLELKVVDSTGRPVAATILLRALDPRVSPFGPVELEDGRLLNKGVAAVDWLVDVTYIVDGEPRTITKEFTVPPDELVTVIVVADP